MTIDGLILAGAVIGIIVGLAFRNPKLGCLFLGVVPLAMIAYVYAWQIAHPEKLRSTSGLDYFFRPLWPSLGAIVGYILGAVIRYTALEKRNDT